MLLVLLPSPIVRVNVLNAVAPDPVIESMVVFAAMLNVPLLATPELAAIVPVALSANEPALMVVAPV